ncbi:MAG: hypothetical protein ACRDPF_15215, partial [Streptosporangiaceae bacterium]
PTLRAAEVGITPALLQKQGSRQQAGASACHLGRLTPLARAARRLIRIGDLDDVQRLVMMP